jgi:hypothetical protein
VPDISRQIVFCNLQDFNVIFVFIGFFFYVSNLDCYPVVVRSTNMTIFITLCLNSLPVFHLILHTLLVFPYMLLKNLMYDGGSLCICILVHVRVSAV